MVVPPPEQDSVGVSDGRVIHRGQDVLFRSQRAGHWGWYPVVLWKERMEPQRLCSALQTSHTVVEVSLKTRSNQRGSL